MGLAVLREAEDQTMKQQVLALLTQSQHPFAP
jgi:hypothetical protein